MLKAVELVEDKKNSTDFFYPKSCQVYNINLKEIGFSSERALKKALRDTLTRAAWYCEISSNCGKKKDFRSSNVSILCSCLNIVIFISSVHISMLSGKPPERNKFPRNVFKFAGLARN